ncbi:MAG: SatD family protein [Candidatus Hermodarchaeota archaeon]
MDERAVIAAIIDIVASRDADVRERRRLDEEIRGLLDQTYKRFKEYCVATPAMTQGDSVELLVSSLQPIVFLFHRLLMDGLEFRVGLGTGGVVLQKENADECDGPAFWNAREALDEIKRMRYMNRTAGFKIDEKASNNENNAVVNSTLFLTTLLGLSTTQLQHCFYYIWEKKRISEIAQAVKTSKANVSKTLSRTPCYLLEKVMSFLDRQLAW